MKNTQTYFLIMTVHMTIIKSLLSEKLYHPEKILLSDKSVWPSISDWERIWMNGTNALDDEASGVVRRNKRYLQPRGGGAPALAGAGARARRRAACRALRRRLRRRPRRGARRAPPATRAATPPPRSPPCAPPWNWTPFISINRVVHCIVNEYRCLLH